MGMPGPQIVKRYDVELELAAAAMSESPRVLVQDVAESQLGRIQASKAHEVIN